MYRGKPFTKPAPISVYVTIPPYPNCGFTEEFTSRVGTCGTEAEIAPMIAKDLRAMGDTFGGLIEPVSTKGRRYRAFRAEWSEIAVKSRA
jgi:hypothetical protein